MKYHHVARIFQTGGLLIPTTQEGIHKYQSCYLHMRKGKKSVLLIQVVVISGVIQKLQDT